MQAGKRHYFRDAQRRSPGKYDVFWGGAINDPQVRPVAGGQMLVESQVLPDGAYTWVVEATDDAGRTEKAEGQITLSGADTTLPELQNFTVVPQEFTPNQDSIRRSGLDRLLSQQEGRARPGLPGAGPDPARPAQAEIPDRGEESSVEGDAGRRGLSRLRL